MLAAAGSAAGPVPIFWRENAADLSGFDVTWARTTTGTYHPDTHIVTQAVSVNSASAITLADGSHLLALGSASGVGNSEWITLFQVNAAATAATAPLGCVPVNAVNYFQITALSGGGFVEAWSVHNQVFTQIYDANFQAVGNFFSQSAGGTVDSVAVTGLSDGGYLLAYIDSVGDGGQPVVMAERFNASGQAIDLGVTVSAISTSPNGMLVLGTAGTDSLYGSYGSDSFVASAGSDSIDGGPGNDIIDFSAILSTGTTIDFNVHQVFAGPAIGTLNFRSIETIIGTQSTDIIGAEASTINGGPRQFDGQGGDDQLFGGAFADTLIGGAGNDTLTAAAGDDLLSGGGGADRIDGGSGNNTLSYEGVQTGMTMQMGTAISEMGNIVGFRVYAGEPLGADYGINIQNVIGSESTDIIGGDDNAQRFEGRGGSDTMFGWYGNDSLYGGDSSDMLFGQQSDDSLSGGAGADYLFGWAGFDSLSGGDGADIFYYGGFGESIDTVVDYSLAQGDALYVPTAWRSGMTLTQSGVDTKIYSPDGNQIFIIQNTLLADIRFTDFIPI